MTSEARGRALAEDEAVPGAGDERLPDVEPVALRRRRGADDDTAQPPAVDDRRARISFPLVPVLAALLLLLLGAAGWLWATRPEPSSITTGDYVDVLQAARSEVVDLTSFDYVTLDEDIEQARRITTGDLRDEAVSQLDDNRQRLADTEAVVQTEVVGAAVTRADAEHGTVLLVIQSTQKTNADEQAQVIRYRIQAELTQVDGRWLLSGLTGR
ncbi:hypothetical protein [Geodermatophilus sp. URMC 64]